MNKEDVIKYIEQQEKNLAFYKRQVNRLEQILGDIHKLDKTEWLKPSELNLKLDNFSKEQIETAFYKAKQYEGLITNEFTTVLDTFIEFLNETHHSLNKTKND